MPNLSIAACLDELQHIQHKTWKQKQRHPILKNQRGRAQLFLYQYIGQHKTSNEQVDANEVIIGLCLVPLAQDEHHKNQNQTASSGVQVSHEAVKIVIKLE
jgi:hypothetical protein